MARRAVVARRQATAVAKVRTGIRGLDEILEGGLPRGRSTLICGDAGSGKSLLAIEFLLRGARELGEPGVLVTFEETADEIVRDAASLGFALRDEIRRKRLAVDYVSVDRSELRTAGDYDLDGLFVRLAHAIDSVGAKRVVLDSIEALFAGLGDSGVLRAEIWRLLRWLKERGLTAVVTAERGSGALTRHGVEEYVSDCVILLKNEVANLIATRRLRVVKYRGSRHSTDEYPFLVADGGISVLPITSIGLTHGASSARVSSGVAGLDAMLGGKGFYRGSSVLVSGASGTGKTSLAAHFVDAACRRGERALLVLMEESPDQIVRNMRSIGIDLERWRRSGRLRIHAARPSLCGLETHLVNLHRLTEEFRPAVIAFDPISNLISIGTSSEARSVVTRLVDHLKSGEVTALFTSLTQASADPDASDIGISSIMDSWLSVLYAETNGERNRVLYVLKSRGMAHSNQVREFRFSSRGIELIDAYVGPAGVLTGTARLAHEARDALDERTRAEDFARRRRELDRRHREILAQLDTLRSERATTEQEIRVIAAQEGARRSTRARDEAAMASARHVASAPARRGRSAGAARGARP